EIPSPRADVLVEQCHFANSLGGEPRDLRDDVAGPAADLASPDRRHDAVRTLRVAAHRDLHPSLERPLAMHRQLTGKDSVAQSESPARNTEAACAEPLAEVRDRPGSERDVDVRIELEQPFPLCLGVASADRDHLVGVAALQRCGLRQVRRELLIRLLANRARVEDENIGLVPCDSLAEPELLEHALDPLAVVSVHLAAERRDVVPPHGPECYPWCSRTRPPSGCSVWQPSRCWRSRARPSSTSSSRAPNRA